MHYLTADFGSTYTKLTAIDGGQGKVLGTASAFTTIEVDVMHGFNLAMQRLEEQIGKFAYDHLLCCSSAAGGLKMVALGLVPDLTAKAAKLAAASAGAKVVRTYSFEISKAEQDEIFAINPDLVLLCGGTDGGNKEVIVANAKRLSQINRNFAIIVAGNKSASHEIDAVLADSGKSYSIVENVMPEFNKLNIEPAKKRINELFISNIVDAKGLGGVQHLTPHKIVPTPLAVFNACELLSRGTANTSGLGELVAVDLGGATTDVYSMAQGAPTLSNVVLKGFAEPFSKRTVEGDLGMRYSLESLIDESDVQLLASQMGVSKDAVERWVASCVSNPDQLASPHSEEQRIEEGIARAAVAIATQRHCGVLEPAYTPFGQVYMLTGKDLSQVPYVVGIGGAIIKSANPAYILQGATAQPNQLMYAKPQKPRYFIDSRYIFASMGLLAALEPELALSIMKSELTVIN